MEEDITKLLNMLDRMNKLNATFMLVAVDVLEDDRLAPFKGVGAESMKLYRELSARYWS